ncbi:MAG: dihydroorotate dehydrogenase electron transfer subunit [Planctomycetota bacterium]
MTPALHAKHYADDLQQVTRPLLMNDQVADDTHLMRIHAPEIAGRTRPGQFVMVRMADVNAPLIGRALAVFDVHEGPDGRPATIDLIYLKKGALTTPLAQSPNGTDVTVWGPLGNGFADRPCDRLIMAAGGIGQTPMLMAGRDALARGWARHVELIYGARRGGLLAGVEQFEAAGFDLTLCTDDGSRGLQQRVPDVVRDRLDQLGDQSPDEIVRVITCGPEIMMEKVSEACMQHSVDCQVSMETPMACGIGICFSCVAKVWQEDGDWDYKRTCVEGPIFDGGKICWEKGGSAG